MTCTRCPESWVYLDRIVKRPTCSFCGQAWSQKTLTLGTKAVGQVQKVEQGAKPKLVPPENRNGGWNQAVGQEEEQSGTALAHVWDCYPQRCAKPAGRCRLLSPRQPTSGAFPSWQKQATEKGKGKGKGGLKEKREATKLLWEQATEDQQKLLEAAGLRQPVEAKPELKELCKKI